MVGLRWEMHKEHSVGDKADILENDFISLKKRHKDPAI